MTDELQTDDGSKRRRSLKPIIVVALVVTILVVILGVTARSQEKKDPMLDPFVRTYGARYSDPVSTYYSQVAYESANGRQIVFSDGHLRSYAESQIVRNGNEQPSSIGFELYRLPLEADMSESTNMDIYNNYVAKELGLYMNFMAKNPTENGILAADKEFMNYCSYAAGEGSDAGFEKDNDFIANMMDVAKSVVAKYGSAANYTIQPAEIDTTDPTKTNFTTGEFSINERDDSDNVIQFRQGNVDIVIAVDTYDAAGNLTRQYETVKGKNIMFVRQPFDKDYSHISIGLF